MQKALKDAGLRYQDLDEVVLLDYTQFNHIIGPRMSKACCDIDTLAPHDTASRRMTPHATSDLSIRLSAQACWWFNKNVCCTRACPQISWWQGVESECVLAYARLWALGLWLLTYNS